MPNLTKIPKYELETLLKMNSISKIAKQEGIHRGTIAKWMKEYGIESRYFVNKTLDISQLKEDSHQLSIPEILIKYNINSTELKYHLKQLPIIEFTL